MIKGHIFFGKSASTSWNQKKLESNVSNYIHHSIDIRDYDKLDFLFKKYNSDIKLVIHAAAQPSHDWAAKEPITDFTINANGTINLLELTRLYSEKAVFILTSTNKVYGDRPNYLPIIEQNTRWEIEVNHPYYQNGIDEKMSIDSTLHSLFGASKAAGDLVAQEYGKYFNMNVGIYRGGCLTGPQHSGTELHGFLAYIMKCCITGEQYTVFGYKGKQVRDNIHSWDLVNMFLNFFENPRPGEVYNVGGGRFSNCSVLEAIELCEKITEKKLNYKYSDSNRIGDHIWWISDVSKFKNHYPDWNWKFGLIEILQQMFDIMKVRY